MNPKPKSVKYTTNARSSEDYEEIRRVFNYSNHDMVVVAYDGVSAQIYRKYRAKQLDAIDDPLAAVLKVKACY